MICLINETHLERQFTFASCKLRIIVLLLFHKPSKTVAYNRVLSLMKDANHVVYTKQTFLISAKIRSSIVSHYRCGRDQMNGSSSDSLAKK